ncbi:cupin domain-containing protein [Sphingobium sp. CCH11-B1]|jgi:mannose-6-phosphate isomerase-like protein (cupin superfamily)|uniref:cupin domain-containing protein n=1 Tax=Sphingobium sp. CCH11-B1 TaxID=1768781 RepID=UPI0008376051|nr:cupin domain-containing protein [Sphingobium sp. CCH11-B1]MEA3390230.1 cupin domain-containing protein [Pseudomonadota bacterium]
MIPALILLLAAATPSPDPVVVQKEDAEHYVWGGVNDGWHLVKGDDLSVIAERLQPGSSEVRHRHAKARQFFYVLSGELTMEAAGVSHRLTAGQGVEIAPGTPHQAQNRSAAPVDILVISSPKSHGDRIEEPAG